MSPEKIISLDHVKEFAKQYLVPADTTGFGCIDDRNPNFKVKVPGAVYAVIDVLKSTFEFTEEQAWNRFMSTGLLPDVHTDTHHGKKGCAYGKTVENNPQAVLAPEAIPVEQRYDCAVEKGGTSTEYAGDHHGNYAVINNRIGTTLHSQGFLSASQQELGSEEPLGSFCYDRWFMGALAEKLGVDAEKFTTHMDAVYNATLTALGVPPEKRITIE